MSAFDWRNPDYAPIYAQRAEWLRRLRTDPAMLAAVKVHYKAHPIDFIRDWGTTLDPRLASGDRPTTVPFLLMPRQVQYLEWVLERMRNKEPGICEKARDSGISNLSIALACALCLFNDGIVVGFGSRKLELVDQIGAPKSLLEKARLFLAEIPPEFLGGWLRDKHAPLGRIIFPGTHSAMTGEGGDQMGRGDRATLYFVDEAAFIERPELSDASLSATTNTRIDVSTPNGMANSFAIKRHAGNISVFTYRWSDDLRKDQAWYERQRQNLDEVTLGQEVDINYHASTEGQLIKVEWVHAAIGAAEALGLEITGARRAALDVADEGRDANALAVRQGPSLLHVESWRGKGSTIYKTTARAMNRCEAMGVGSFDYDSDGLGSGVRGDAVAINEKRLEEGKHEIEAVPFRGSGAVFDPEGSLVEGRLNKDYFANQKAQSWWAVRSLFEAAFRARREGASVSEDALISIDPDLPELNQLMSELTQVQYEINTVGKVVIQKMPDGAMSPNLADALMMCFSPFQRGAYFSGVMAARGEGAVPQAPVMPMWFDKVFASLIVQGDVAAVVYCAAIAPGSAGERGVALWVLDYDVCVLTEGADVWLTGLEDHLIEVRDVTPAAGHAVLHGIYVDDFEEGWSHALMQLGVSTNVVGDDLPPLIERFNKSQPYSTRGLVALGPVATRKEIWFKGARRNFLREVVTRSAPTESPLALSFATAVLLTYHGRASVPTPNLIPEQFKRPDPLPPPLLPEVIAEPGVMLRPGAHTIDGVPLTVLRDGDNDYTFLKLTVGKHVIDGVQDWVRRPGVGNVIGVEELHLYR